MLTQFLILGLVFAVMSLGWSTMLVFAMRPLGRMVSRMGWLQRWKGKLIGVIFVTLGVRVAFQRQ